MKAQNTGLVLEREVQSDTVHKYQGREKDIIIMSTVLSETSRQFDLDFVDDEQMVNVAVSRAKKQFILVTDQDLFYKKGNNISDLIRYMEYSTLDQNVVESQIVSIFDLLYQKYSNKLIKYRRKMKSSATYQSEEGVRVLLDEIFSEKEYGGFTYVQEMLIKNLLSDTGLLSNEELSFVNHRASLDFVIYYKIGKVCALVIEVDGFAFHENNPKQLERDRMKNHILQKYHIPVLRLATNGSGEKERIEKTLKQIMTSEIEV